MKINILFSWGCIQLEKNENKYFEKMKIKY